MAFTSLQLIFIQLGKSGLAGRGCQVVELEEVMSLEDGTGGLKETQVRESKFQASTLTPLLSM